jgi:hypothetical protein
VTIGLEGSPAMAGAGDLRGNCYDDTALLGFLVAMVWPEEEEEVAGCAGC